MDCPRDGDAGEIFHAPVHIREIGFGATWACPYAVAEHRMKQRLAKMRDEDEAYGIKPATEYYPDSTLTEYDRCMIEPRPIMRLDKDIFKAMYKIELMERCCKNCRGWAAVRAVRRIASRWPKILSRARRSRPTAASSCANGYAT